MSPDLPRTYQASLVRFGGQSPIFDPALKQFRQAFRAGDPRFPDEATAIRWRFARRCATDFVLRLIAESHWGALLVLRGSRLLKAWFGDRAREPGDLDFVATTLPVRAGDDIASQLGKLIASQPAPAGLVFECSQIASDEIWTYERAQGRRIVVPWQLYDVHGGSVQVDVTFNEDIPDATNFDPIPLADGGCVRVRAVGPEMSLAWKLVWLATDMYPQAKDVYDAVLLAEAVRFSADFHERFVVPAGVAAFDATRLRVAWDDFVKEYPWIGGSGSEWLNRLADALPLVPENGPAARIGLAAIRPEWRTSTVLGLTHGIVEDFAYGRLPILADALEEAGCTDADLLGHCRGNGPHQDGCWVVDLLLGTE